MGIRVFIIPHCRKNVKLRFSLQKNPHLMTNFQHFCIKKRYLTLTNFGEWSIIQKRGFFPKNDIFCKEKANFSLNVNLTKS